VLVHPDDRARIIDLWTHSVATGEPYDAEHRVLRADGTYGWLQSRGLPLRDINGNIVRWYNLLTDIDDQKRAEDSIRASELELRLIVDTIPGFVWTMSAAGDVESVNQQMLEYFGKPLEELHDWSSFLHPDDRSRVVANWTRTIETGQPYEIEHRLRRPDGIYRWFEARGLPLRDPQGHVIRWYNLLIDIDDRKRAEEALATNERNLKLIIDTIPAMAWSARPDGSAEFVNQHYIDFTGLPAEQASGWGWMRAVHPEDLDDLTATWQRILASEAAGEAEARLRRHDGAYRWFLFRANPLRDESGAIVKWYGMSTDIEDRKRAEQEQRRSEARKTAILDSALDCIVTIDHEGCVTEFNPAAERTFGYRRDEVLGQQLADVIIPPAFRERHRQGFARYLATGETRVLGKRIEMTAVRADGSEFPTELAITRIPLDGPPSFTGYLRDITERKRAEAELRRSEAFLAQAQRLTLTGSLWWKVSTGEITWSDESYRLMGYPTTIKPTIDLILNRVHPEDLSLVRETVDRSAREGANIDFEHRLLMPEGSVKHVHVVVQNVSGESGPPEFVGAISDITERKRDEAELRRAYDSFADAQRLSHTGSFITDLVGDDHNWSEETYRIFEFEPGTKVTVQRVREIIHPDDQPSFESMISRAMSGVDVTFSFRIVTARGAVKYVRGVAHVIEQIEGRPMFVGALQDVTESMVAEEALNRARSELAHVARVTTLSTLTASIAHEVNQPLSGIITNASTCLRMLGADPPDVDGARETVRRTIRDGNRASDVITRLRALFGKKEFTLESLDLNDATREVIALSLSDLQRHRVVLQSDLADDLPLITGDRVQLQQVILNLLRNASDAMVDVHERPRLLLIKTEREDGNRVRLSVRDAGMGLPPQSLDSLFDAFYTTKSGGMGIGLSVSRSIVERHQGRLWAEPNDGPGATFSLSVPFQTA
jgi:PAS domain S-box-containing protein